MRAVQILLPSSAKFAAAAAILNISIPLSAVVLVEGIATVITESIRIQGVKPLADLVFQFGPEAWIPATEGILPVLIQHARPDLQHGLRGVDGELTGE